MFRQEFSKQSKCVWFLVSFLSVFGQSKKKHRAIRIYQRYAAQVQILLFFFPFCLQETRQLNTVYCLSSYGKMIWKIKGHWATKYQLTWLEELERTFQPPVGQQTMFL